MDDRDAVREPGVDDAWTVAAEAAARAEVDLVEVHHPPQARLVAALLDEVWGRDSDAATILAPEALLALGHAGGQVTAAFDEGRLVGATAAFIGWDGHVAWLHSHVTGVVSSALGRGIGTALKWHQRAWCLQRGLTTVRWTFDPLIRRNAVLNLVVLGAQVEDHLEDLYGPMPDVRNAGLPTDRLAVRWDLTAPRVLAAARGRGAAPDLAGLRRSGAAPVLHVGADGGPVVTDIHPPRRLVQVPDDIEGIRAKDRGLALQWAEASRQVLGGSLRSGWQVRGATRDGWYVLSRETAVAELRGDA